MHTSNEPTIAAEMASLTPEGYHRELTKVADAKHASARRAGKTAHADNVILRVHGGRQVLRPGSRTAVRHPWANRLEAARTGGFVVDQIHPDTDRVNAACYSCGARFHVDIPNLHGNRGIKSKAVRDHAAEAAFDAECARHDSRECMNGVVL